MWYHSPPNSPQSRVSPNKMVAGVATDPRSTGRVVVAERSSEPIFFPNTIPIAAASGPGTEYWLP